MIGLNEDRDPAIPLLRFKPLLGVVLTILISCQSGKVHPASVVSVRLLMKETVRQSIMICVFLRLCFSPQVL